MRAAAYRVSRVARHLTFAAAAAALAACAQHKTATRPAPEPGAGRPTVIGPAAGAAPAPRPQAGIDRTRPPRLGPPPSLSLPAMQRRQLPNGLKLVVVEQHELPVADFILLVGTGAEADPADHVGLATLTADMLDEGTAARTGADVADQEAYLGAELGAASGWDATRITLHTPTAQLDSALALFAEVALTPTFPEAELERLKKERLTSLLQLRDRPTTIADFAFASILYGADHPYGRPLVGTERTTKNITKADVERFYRSYFRPNNATLIVVGDVKADDVTRRAERLFGAWPRGEVPPVRLGRAPAPAATTVYLIDKPGAPQSSLRIGAVGVARTTQDFFALQVLNTILGGSFASRLNMNLRESHGYSYGAQSAFAMRREPGPFTARAEVTGSKTDSSVVEFLKELKSIRDTVPAAELSKAKQLIQLGLPQRFESTGDIASALMAVVLYDLPADYYNTYVQQIERVTQADLQRVAQKYIDPAHLAIIVVGDRKTIQPGLEALKVGPVSVRDLTGAPERQ